MPGADQADLVAISLPSPAAAQAIRRTWDDGEAVAVLDPQAPRPRVEQALGLLQPTHLIDEDGRRRLPDGRPVDHAVAAVVLTSGTTGAPKAVELTQAGRDAIGRGFAAALDTGPGDRWLACLPLHHVAGLAIIGRSVASGVPVVTHRGFDLDAVATSPEREGTTIVSLVPTTLARLLDAGAPVSRYRVVIVGGAPLSGALRERAATAGVSCVDTYGLSETWGGVLLDGNAVPGAEVTVDQAGEILVRGPMVMRAYRGDAEATADAFTPDGHFRTGDLGHITADGRVRVMDRRRDLIITGAVNVSPTAVEGVLLRHPSVADVCVTGRTDDEWGERVVAFVVPRDRTDPPSLDELRAFARDHLSAAQLPREVRSVDEIPRTPGGKARRDLLPD
jgi:O-succinylbenzoic acid--CoA ligase